MLRHCFLSYISLLRRKRTSMGSSYSSISSQPTA